MNPFTNSAVVMTPQSQRRGIVPRPDRKELTMKLMDIVERRNAVEAEMQGLYDAAEKAGEDLSGEKLETWTKLDHERRDLKAKEDRARTRDELARQADAKPIVEKRPQDTWALTNEQRWADYVSAQSGESCEGLSLGRGIAALLRGDWRGAEAEKRAMGTTSNVAGGFFVPDLVSANVIDLVRNRSVLSAAGALTVPMTANNMTMVRVITDPTAAWRAEGATISESDSEFGAILIVPNSVAALCRVNAELLDDVPSFASTLDGMLAAALAQKLDHAGLYGSGVGAEPTGLRNISTSDGINEISMGTNGATPTDYDDFLDLIRDVELDNGSPDTVIMSPRTKATLAQIKTGITSDLTKLQAPADFAALRRVVSNQVSITETQGSSGVASTAFIGGFSNMAIAMRQNIQIEASRTSGTAFEKNQVMVRAILRADIAVMRPAMFGRLIGITA